MSKTSVQITGVSWNDFAEWDNYEAKISSQDFTNLIRYIEGTMLTIADASFTDLNQREAVKSLMKKALWGEIKENVQRCLFQREKNEKSPNGQAEIYPLG